MSLVELRSVILPMGLVIGDVMDAARARGQHAEYEWRGDGRPMGEVVNEHLDHAAKHMLPLCRDGWNGTPEQWEDLTHAATRLALAIAAVEQRQRLEARG